MKKGRTRWDTRIAASKLRLVNAMIDGGARSGRAIFDHYNLSRYLTLSTFRKYVTQRRRDRAARKTPGRPARGVTGGSGSSSSSSSQPGAELLTAAGELMTLTLDQAREEIAAGRVGKVKLSALLGQLKEIKELFDVTLIAEQRAAELHAAKMVQLRAKLKRAIGAKTDGGKKKLTRAAVYDEIDRIMRGEQ